MPINTKSDRNRHLIEAVKNGATLSAVAREHGITRQAAQQIWKRAGNPPLRPVAQALTEEEKQRAVEQYRRGLPIAYIETSRPVRTVYDYLVAIGVHVPATGARSWWPEEDRKLKRHWGHESAQFIADNLNRTRDEVIGRAHRLKLSKLDPNEAKRRYREERAA